MHYTCTCPARQPYTVQIFILHPVISYCGACKCHWRLNKFLCKIWLAYCKVLICSHEMQTNDWGEKHMFSHLQLSTTDNTDWYHFWFFMSPACSGLHESFDCGLIDPEHDLQNSKHHVSPPAPSQRDSLFKLDTTAVATCCCQLTDWFFFPPQPPLLPTRHTHVHWHHHLTPWQRVRKADECHSIASWLLLMSSMQQDSLTDSYHDNARISMRPRWENVSG